MKRWQSGLLIAGVGIVLNALGRLAIRTAGEQQSVAVAGALLILMIGSVVIGLLGLIRLVTGIITKS
jgi:hypothetical protein